MTVPCLAHSQDTSRITITSDQLRTANLIFAEHKEYSNLVPLLRQENSNLILINESWEHTDSIRKIQLLYCHQEIEKRNNSIDNLSKSLNKKQNIIEYGACASVITIILCLFLK